MQSHLPIGRIILAVSICVSNFVECSPCSGWPGYCLNRTNYQQRDQISEAIDSHHCHNISQNENYRPCSFSSQSCVLVLVNEKWLSGCVADDHGLFVHYDTSKTPLTATYSNSVSIGSFCTKRKQETECNPTSILSEDKVLEAEVCCCKTSACTAAYLRMWKEGRSRVKPRREMISLGIVVALGVVQAMMLSTALIALIHDYYSRYRVRIVIGEAEKSK